MTRKDTKRSKRLSEQLLDKRHALARLSGGLRNQLDSELTAKERATLMEAARILEALADRCARREREQRVVEEEHERQLVLDGAEIARYAETVLGSRTGAALIAEVRHYRGYLDALSREILRRPIGDDVSFLRALDEAGWGDGRALREIIGEWARRLDRHPDPERRRSPEDYHRWRRMSASDSDSTVGS